MSSQKKSPNEIASLKANFNITIFWSVVVIIIIFIGTYCFFDKARNEITFAAGVLGAGCAVYSAFYAGRAIYQNLEEKKIDRTVEAATKWNESNLKTAKQTVRQIGKLIISEPDESKRLVIIEREINNQIDKEMDLIEILNFLERICVFINKGITDEDLSKEFYKTLILSHFFAYEPWIKKLRAAPGASKTIFIHLETVAKRWQSSP